MNCPICNEKLTLLTGGTVEEGLTYSYACCNGNGNHFMTGIYRSKHDAIAEVESAHSFCSSSKQAYWNIKLGGNIVCSHCGHVVGTMNKGSDYDAIVQKSKFCNNCGRMMSKPTITSSALPVIPEAITVADYNEFYRQYKSHAESFIKLVDSAIDKCDLPNATRKQFECIGWNDEVKNTICIALQMYEQIMKSKCIGKIVDSRYRDVVLCKHCDKCMIKTSDGYLCRERGLMPFDGYCSSGIVGKAKDGKAE